jgi:hypothetical protein
MGERTKVRVKIAFIRRIVAMNPGKPTIADLRHIRSALLNFKSLKNGALLILKRRSSFLENSFLIWYPLTGKGRSLLRRVSILSFEVLAGWECPKKKG